MEFRYSQILTNIFMCFIYSTGMPVLYIIAMITFFLTYWVDKFLFITVYKTPPRYDIALMRTVRGTLKYAIILHYMFGFYMISNTNIMTYSGDFTFLSSIKDQVEKANDKIGKNNYFTT
jgi:hypothetical protein